LEFTKAQKKLFLSKHPMNSSLQTTVGAIAAVVSGFRKIVCVVQKMFLIPKTIVFANEKIFFTPQTIFPVKKKTFSAQRQLCSTQRRSSPR